MEKREKLRRFLAGVLERKGDAAPFADDDSLLLAGRIDSLNVLEIVGFLEKDLNYNLSDQGFDQTHFDSVDSIMDLVEGRTAG